MICLHFGQRPDVARVTFSRCRRQRIDMKSAVSISSLVIAMALFEASACYAQDGRAPAPTGRLVDAGGHRLHLHVMGKGKPVVVFEGGSGDFSFIWDLVQPEVSKKATTVSYDRAGYAWSENGPSPRTGRQISYELHKALHNAGIDGPYILVGQSFGGFLVRYFAHFYPGEVAGMVLVDALNEDSRIVIGHQPFRIRDWAKGRQAPPVRDTIVSPSTSIAEVVPDTTLEFPLNKLPPADQKIQIWAQSQPAHRQAGNGEMDWSPEDVADLYAHKGMPGYVLGDLPLIVLSRGAGGYEGLADSAALENERLNLQADLTRLSTNSKHVIVSNSGHNIHLEQPGVVIDAIGQVIHAYLAHAKLEQ